MRGFLSVWVASRNWAASPAATAAIKFSSTVFLLKYGISLTSAARYAVLTCTRLYIRRNRLLRQLFAFPVPRR